MGMTFAPQKNAHPALHVEDVAAARAELEAKGVEFLGETLDTGVCHMALFTDPDGNDLMLHNRYAPYSRHGVASLFTPQHRGGSGPPLVCLHGFTDTWRTWELVLPALERSHDVLAPTLLATPAGRRWRASSATSC